MIKEIGSEFWIDNISQTDGINEGLEWIKKFGDITLTSCGRGAISLILGEAVVKAKTALLPSYVCNTVILPFIEQGYNCFFYKINNDLTPNLNDIMRYKDIGVFLHMGYFGFPTNSSLLPVIRHFKAESTVIVEDITHTLFSDYERFCDNDYQVASLRKWAGVPSGGFLASKMAISSQPKRNETFAEIRKKALQKKARYMNGDNEVLKQQYLELFAQGEQYLNHCVTPFEIDSVSKALISSLDVKKLIHTRRSNFKTLSEKLSDITYIEPIFSDLPDNICPLFYPVYIKKNRNEVQQRLAEHEVYCPVHWHVSEHVKDSEIIENIYDIILSIPCDQRYGLNDMLRITEVMRNLQKQSQNERV